MGLGQARECVLSRLSLIRTRRIGRNLRIVRPAPDRLDLTLGRSGLGQPPRDRFPKAVRRAMPEASFWLSKLTSSSR